jgi:hypothetical protein
VVLGPCIPHEAFVITIPGFFGAAPEVSINTLSSLTEAGLGKHNSMVETGRLCPIQHKSWTDGSKRALWCVFLYKEQKKDNK